MLDEPLSLLAAQAIFCGWDPEGHETFGFVDEASEETLRRWVDRDYQRGHELEARCFIVNGEAPCFAPDFIEYNRHDPDALYGAGQLRVGETWGGGAGGDVRRIA